MSERDKVTPEPRAELVQRARELLRDVPAPALAHQAAVANIAAALADVEREAEAALARKARRAALATLEADGFTEGSVNVIAVHGGDSEECAAMARALLAALDALPKESTDAET
jgi:hypothetical protein